MDELPNTLWGVVDWFRKNRSSLKRRINAVDSTAEQVSLKELFDQTVYTADWIEEGGAGQLHLADFTGYVHTLINELGFLEDEQRCLDEQRRIIAEKEERQERYLERAMF